MMSLFPTTHADRVSLARKRYFEEGILPTGIVSEAVFQSWSRCYRAHQKPMEKIEFQPVSNSRSQLALQKNRILHQAWLNEITTLGRVLGTANCSAILTDATGVLIGVSPSQHHEQRIIPVAHRVGVNLSEEYVGTTAPGLVARTGKPSSVLGSEHFYEAVSSMHCTAAPIRNIQGQLAGILDISSEGSPFNFDPSPVVGLYAASIENRLLIAQSNEHLVVKFQFIPAILETPMVGIVGFDGGGELLWTNTVASNLLGLKISREERGQCAVEDIFESTFSQLVSLVGRGLVAQRLRNGLQIFLTCHLQQKSLGQSPLVVSAQSPSQSWGPPATSAISLSAYDLVKKIEPPLVVDSLKQADADLIQNYLSECNGNVSQVARKLKVSRGLIYRRLQELNLEAAAFKYK